LNVSAEHIEEAVAIFAKVMDQMKKEVEAAQ
jgi:hypothetical protein